MARLTLLSIYFLLVPSTLCLVRRDNVGRLPALGWNSWNAFHCNVSEANLLVAARSMKSLGLQDAGYTYVNSDDCWSVPDRRDPTTRRIIPDPDKFPSGIKGTAAQLHAMGFKMGIYSSAGNQTCAGYPASLGYEEVDAAAWADWGIDYLKYDNCGTSGLAGYNWTDQYLACRPDNFTVNTKANNGSCGVPNTTNHLAPVGYDWSTSKTHTRFTRMRVALQKQKRTILYSLCEWGYAGVKSWGNSTGNSWRTTDDIQPYWYRVTNILNENAFYTHATGFWGHNDLDMLEVGNGNFTLAECRTHFAFWALAKSPLLIGTELANLSSAQVDILKNKYLLAFNQDPVYGQSAAPYKWGVNPDWTFDPDHPAEYWSGKFQGGVMVAMFNSNNGTEERTINFHEVPELKGKGNSFHIQNVWTGAGKACNAGGITQNLEPHDTAVWIVGKAC